MNANNCEVKAMNRWIRLPLRGADFCRLCSAFLGGLGHGVFASGLLGAFLAHLAFLGGGDGFPAAVSGKCGRGEGEDGGKDR